MPPSGLVDLHSHLMPGVDDGARDETDARVALAELAEQGVERIVTTPHLPASATEADGGARVLERLDEGWRRLEEVAAGDFPRLELGRGVELRLDVPRPDVGDPRLRLAGGPAVLVEFSGFRVPHESVAPFAHLAERGWTPVLAHPERYAGLAERPELAEAWREAGARLQVNGPSLLGRFGERAEALAWRLLAEGRADCLASDHHARGAPEVEAARRRVVEAGGEEAADRLMVENPARILAGEDPLPVPPVRREPAGLWERVRSWLGG